MGQKASVLGLDIGSHSIKAACVERSRRCRDGWRLLGAAMVPTPPESVTGGMIQDPVRVAEAIRGLLREAHLPASEAVAAVSGSPVSVRGIKVPDLPAAALRRSIRFEAAKFLPSIDDSVVEFEVLGKSGTPPQADVLLVAAPRDMVNARVTVMNAAGLEPVAVDIEAFALLRVLEASNLLPKEGQGVAVANIGNTFTDLNIIVGREVQVTRSIPLGGTALTRSIASLLNVSLEEAERLKRHVGVHPPGQGEDPSAGADAPSGFAASAPAPADASGPTADLLRQATIPFLDEIIREVRRSTNFFQSQAAEAGYAIAIDQLLLTGGTARLPGIAAHMGERLGMDVQLLDPVVTSAPANRNAAASLEYPCELAVAMGLALKEYE